MWTIPDKGEGDNDLQSILFQEYLDALVEGINGRNCVLSGLAVTGGADMTPAVAKGSVLTNGVLKAVAAADVTIGAADATNPRIDLIVVNSSGALAVRAGTAGANPKPPARSTNDVIIAAVYVPANDTSIETTKITDLRVMRDGPSPICIYRTTTAETTNTTNAAFHILDKANSGVVIPNGLFTAGKILRVKIFGNFLFNSGTPTLTLIISFGGTTMFQDVSIAGAADADRGAWFLEFDIVAQATNDQALGGRMTFSPVIAQRIAPTTGIGDMLLSATAANNPHTFPFSGSAAVDADAADRTLSATFTMSVSNSADEVVVEGATVDLVGV